MTANDSKSYLDYLETLVDEYYNTYHCSIGEKPINADYSAVSEEIETILKLLNLKLTTESELLGIKLFLAKVTPNMNQEKLLLLILC